MAAPMMSPYTLAQMQYQVPPPPPRGGTQIVQPTTMQSISWNPNTASAANSALVNNFLQAKAQVDGYDAYDLEPTPISGLRSHDAAAATACSSGREFPPPQQHPIAPQPSYYNDVPPTVYVPAGQQQIQQQQPLAPRPHLQTDMSSFLPTTMVPMVQMPSAAVQPKMPVLVPQSIPNKREIVSGNATTRRKMTVVRRERNREHAKRSRLRKKSVTESLQQSMIKLKEENERIRTFVQGKLKSDVKDGEQTDAIIDAYIEKVSSEAKSSSSKASDRFVDALKAPQNHVLDDGAKALLSKLAKEVHFPATSNRVATIG